LVNIKVNYSEGFLKNNENNIEILKNKISIWIKQHVDFMENNKKINIRTMSCDGVHIQVLKIFVNNSKNNYEVMVSKEPERFLINKIS